MNHRCLCVFFFISAVLVSNIFLTRPCLHVLSRSGEDNAVSRVLLQAIAESAGVAVPLPFKANHLFLNTGGGESGHVSDGGATTEVIPVVELVPEADAVEELLEGRAESVLIVPKDRRCDSGDSSPLGDSADIADEGNERLEAVVLRDGAVEAALPRGATVILPGSYNPLHRGHLGLLEAARALHSENLEAATGKFGGSAAGVEEGVASKARKGGAVRAVFEVSVSNVDKGGLTAGEVRRRTRQFSDVGGVGWPYPVIVTRSPLFSQKVRKRGLCDIFDLKERGGGSCGLWVLKLWRML